MPKPSSTVAPINSVTATNEQHMLFLFFPLTKGTLPKSITAAQNVFSVLGPNKKGATAGPDPRVSTGVHFFMFYPLPADTTPKPDLPVPSFQTAKGKDLLVVVSIYDADFGPYISAFTSNPSIAAGLNTILGLMDESGIVEPTDPTSAKFILKHGGVARDTTAFYKLLMRYNFADPTIPGAAKFPVNTPPKPKYLFGATFPGLTIGSILQNYPDAPQLWPVTPVDITFEKSAAPPSA